MHEIMSLRSGKDRLFKAIYITFEIDNEPFQLETVRYLLKIVT